MMKPALNIYSYDNVVTRAGTRAGTRQEFRTGSGITSYADEAGPGRDRVWILICSANIINQFKNLIN